MACCCLLAYLLDCFPGVRDNRNCSDTSMANNLILIFFLRSIFIVLMTIYYALWFFKIPYDGLIDFETSLVN